MSAGNYAPVVLALLYKEGMDIRRFMRMHLYYPAKTTKSMWPGWASRDRYSHRKHLWGVCATVQRQIATHRVSNDLQCQSSDKRDAMNSTPVKYCCLSFFCISKTKLARTDTRMHKTGWIIGILSSASRRISNRPANWTAIWIEMKLVAR